MNASGVTGEHSRVVETAGWKTGGPGDRHAAGASTERFRVLIAQAALSQGRGTGDRRVHPPRDSAPHAGTNGLTNRKIEDRVIHPESDAQLAAARDDVLEIYAKP